MTYCRKCGFKLDENARFCRHCGAPTSESSAPSTPEAPKIIPDKKRRRPFLPVAILIGLLLVAFFFAAVTLVPVMPVNSTQSRTAANSGINSVNLNLEADVADVNIIIEDLPGQQVIMEVIAKGSVGVFGSTNPPVKVTFSNETVGQVMTVAAKISRQDTWPLSLNLGVTCNLYIDPAAVLDLNVRTNVGRVVLSDFSSALTIQGLNLQSTTGNVEASLPDQVTLTGNLSATTTTGTISLRWRNINTSGNSTIKLGSTTGAVNAYLTQTRNLAGDITLDAKTTTGRVNLEMNIDGNIGAHITSQKVIGSITANLENFNGNQSPLYSNNYPAASNFEVNLSTTTGSIHIIANYHAPSTSDQQQASNVALAANKQNQP